MGAETASFTGCGGMIHRPITKQLLVLLLLFTISPAFAITTTEALPAGVRALAFVYGQSPWVTSMLNTRGNLEWLAQPLNRSVTMSDLVKSQPRLAQLQSALNTIMPGNPGDQLLVANLYADVAVREQQKVGALFWGLTDNLAVGLVIPQVERTYSGDFRAEVTNNAAAIRARIGDEMPQISDGLKEIENTRVDTDTFVNAIFTSRGYTHPHSFVARGLGDIETEVRYRSFQSPLVDLGLRFTVRAPTASHKPDITNLLDRELGEGAISLRGMSIHSLKIIPNRWWLHSSLTGTWRAPHRKTVALPRTDQGDIPDLADLADPYQIENVHRQAGAQLDLEVGSEVDFLDSGLNFFASYLYSIKGSDRVWGDRSLDYGRLMNDTLSRTHAVEAGFELSAVPLYRAKIVPIPGKLIFTWHRPLMGQNATYASFGRLDAILFF